MVDLLEIAEEEGSKDDVQPRKLCLLLISISSFLIRILPTEGIHIQQVKLFDLVFDPKACLALTMQERAICIFLSYLLILNGYKSHFIFLKIFCTYLAHFSTALDAYE